METGPKDYGISGTSADKAFNALGSLGTMAFAYNTVILPEIQVSTALHTMLLQMSRSEVRVVFEAFGVCMVLVTVHWSNAVICQSHVLVYSTDMYHCNAWHESTACCTPFCSASLPAVSLTNHADSALPRHLACCLMTSWFHIPCHKFAPPRCQVDKSTSSREFVEACLDTFGEENCFKLGITKRADQGHVCRQLFGPLQHAT